MANINNIENIKTLQSWDVPVVIHRTNAQPIDNASYFTQLSDAENYALSGATSYVGQELFVVNTTLSTADAYVIQDISGSLKKLATTIDVQQLSSDLSGEIDQLSADLSGEIDNLSTDLSNAISSKIFVGEQTQSSVTGDFTDLSVIKISRADYEAAVATTAKSGIDLSNNVLYVISSDYIDAYEQQIKNVVMEDDNVPSDAATKHFVEQLSDKISQTIDNNIDAICAVISNDISGYISGINDTIDNKLCVAISNNADDISTKIWIENRVDQSISAFSNLSVVTLSKDQYAAEMANKSPYGNMDKNVLYLISSDNLDMFGQKIENLTMSDDSTQSEAATQHYVDNLSANQSSNFNAKINALSANLSGEIDLLSSRLSTEIGSLSTSISNDIKQLSSDLSGEIDQLSADLSGEIDNLSTDLSNAISSKIFVGEQTQSSVTGDFTDLSVIKISRADYEQAVVDAANNGVDLSNNVLYVISSDYIDAYERQIKNVVMEDDNTPSDAVNKHFVEQLSDRISQTINKLSDDLSGEIGSLSTFLSNKINTFVKYNDNSISSFNIVGEISSTSIPNKTDMIEISVGSTVTSIGSMALRLCTSLSSIKIPNTVTNIGSYAFQQCSSLTSIQLPDSITNISEYAFLSCTNLVNILLNDNITNIGHTSFRRCSSLTSISIPKSLTAIEDATFISCSNLSNIIIPANITNVGQNAFSNCDNLTKIFVEGKTQQEAENLLSNAGQNANCEIITYARSNWVQALDNEISTKIWIENKIDQTKSPGFSDLSIIKLSDAEYEQLLIDAHFNAIDINEKTLYVISADNVNAYGQRIENLTMTDDTTPSQAATKHYVDNYAGGSIENTLSIHNILSAFDNSKYAANQTLSGGLNLNSDLSVVLSALVEVWKMFGGKTV